MSDEEALSKKQGKPVWLIYANCQAAAIAALLPRIGRLSDSVDIKYVFIHSLEERGKGWDTYPASYMDGVTVVWEQVSEAFPAVRAEFHRRLPETARRIRFPAFTAGMIWPFAAPDPRPSKHRPYLYGDSVAARLGLSLAGRRLTDDQIFSEYMALSYKRMPDLDRSLELELAAWQRRDLDSDISVSAYLIENYRKTQLFYERGRITQYPVRYLIDRLLQESLDANAVNVTSVLEDAARLLKYHQGSDNISQPIHPFVADKLKLEWFDPEAVYRWFMHDWTFRDWIVRCVRLAPYVGGNF